jgi:hypothetical protein
MFGDRDLTGLIDLAGTWRLSNGYQIIIRAEWVDVTVNRPHGISYALVLKDASQDRILGFDNSHGVDGAGENEPFDHEHRPNAIGRQFRYEFVSAWQLVTDFFDRCEKYCRQHDIPFEILEP